MDLLYFLHLFSFYLGSLTKSIPDNHRGIRKEDKPLLSESDFEKLQKWEVGKESLDLSYRRTRGCDVRPVD